MFDRNDEPPTEEGLFGSRALSAPDHLAIVRPMSANATPNVGDDGCAGSRAAAAYKQGKDAGCAPSLRKSKLHEAIRLWNELFSASGPFHTTLHKNIACAHTLLASLPASSSDDSQQEVQRRRFHYDQGILSFSTALRAASAEDRSNAWVDEVLARTSEAFMGLSQSVAGSSLDDKLRLRTAVARLPAPLQADAMIEVVHRIKAHGIIALELGNYAESFKAFREVERPLIEAEQLARRAGSGAHVHTTLSETREEVISCSYISEARGAIQLGDSLVNRALMHSESLDMELVWSAVDKFREAGVLTRERDIETEAIAVARRAKVYANVLRNEALARPLLVQAITLAASLSPRTFHGVPWYDECANKLKEYQDTTAAAAARAAERNRQAELQSQEPTRQKLKKKLDALSTFAAEHNAYELLEHAYDSYPPRHESYTKQPEEMRKRIKDASAETVKKVLRDALVHYHPDKNAAHGVEWKVLSEEIYKHLNDKYDRVKASS